MKSTKMLYGTTFLSDEDLKDTSIIHKVELEYYKIEQPYSYGIEVIKKEYETETPKVEKSTMEGVTNSNEYVETLLDKLCKNKATPIDLEYVVADLKKT